jgi:hypothetical protein
VVVGLEPHLRAGLELAGLRGRVAHGHLPRLLRVEPAVVAGHQETVAVHDRIAVRLIGNEVEILLLPEIPRLLCRQIDESCRDDGVLVFGISLLDFPCAVRREADDLEPLGLHVDDGHAQVVAEAREEAPERGPVLVGREGERMLALVVVEVRLIRLQTNRLYGELVERPLKVTAHPPPPLPRTR